MQRPPERRVFILFLRYWLPVLVYLTVMLVASAQPYLKPPFEFRNSDKIWHVLEYFGFGLLVARAARATLRLTLPLAAAMCALSIGIVVGAGEEYLQSFVPGRISSALDLLADTGGLALAQFVYLAFTRE